jgi:hypothetical protein
MQSETALPRPVGGYTVRQRWVIIASVSVLAVLLTGVAFASGVYIGNNRELAPGVAPGGPPPGQGQGGPQRFGQPQAPGNGVIPQQQAPGNAVPGQQPNPANGVPGQQQPQVGRAGFDTVGSLASFASGTLSVVTPDGTKQIVTDGQTRFTSDDGSPASAASLRPNIVVGVRLRTGGSVADAVTIITGRAPQGQQQPGQQQQGQPAPRN